KFLNAYFADISRLQKYGRIAKEANSLRRSARNDVTRFEGDSLRDVRDEISDAENHLVRVRGLGHFAVVETFDLQILNVIYLVSRSDERTEGCECVESFATGPLTVFPLQIARRHIVHHRVAENVIERVGFAY